MMKKNGKRKNDCNRTEYIEKRDRTLKPGGDFDVIKMMLAKANEKLKTAKIDLDNKRYDDSVSRAY